MNAKLYHWAIPSSPLIFLLDNILRKTAQLVYCWLAVTASSGWSSRQLRMAFTRRRALHGAPPCVTSLHALYQPCPQGGITTVPISQIWKQISRALLIPGQNWKSEPKVGHSAWAPTSPTGTGGDFTRFMWLRWITTMGDSVGIGEEAQQIPELYVSGAGPPFPELPCFLKYLTRIVTNTKQPLLRCPTCPGSPFSGLWRCSDRAPLFGCLSTSGSRLFYFHPTP